MRKFTELVRGRSILDWAFIVLMMVMAGALAIGVFAHVRPGEAPQFAAITYSDPSRVIDEYGQRPVAEGVEDARIPSVIGTEGTIVPLLIERFIDCAVFDCPGTAIPISVTVNWVELNEDGETIGRWTLVENLETTYNEGPDYRQGQLSVVASEILTVAITPEVESQVRNQKQRGISPSLWAIEGVTVPLVESGVPATWRTEVFYIYAPCEADPTSTCGQGQSVESAEEGE